MPNSVTTGPPWIRCSKIASSGASATRVFKRSCSRKIIHLATSVTLAQGSETAAKSVKEMNAPSLKLDSTNSSKVTVKSEPVHRVAGKKPHTREGGMTCHCCGTPGHLATVCKFRESVCHKFKKKWHLARVCRSKPAPQPPFQGIKPKRPILIPSSKSTRSQISTQMIPFSPF